MDANKRSSISRADTLEKIGEFWDTHDFTDYDDPNAPDVEFTISCSVPIEVELPERPPPLTNALRRRRLKRRDCARNWSASASTPLTKIALSDLSISLTKLSPLCYLIGRPEAVPPPAL